MMPRFETIPVCEYRVAEAADLNVYTGFGDFELADDMLEKMRSDHPETPYVLLAVVDA